MGKHEHCSLYLADLICLPTFSYFGKYFKFFMLTSFESKIEECIHKAMKSP